MKPKFPVPVNYDVNKIVSMAGDLTLDSASNNLLLLQPVSLERRADKPMKIVIFSSSTIPRGRKDI